MIHAAFDYTAAVEADRVAVETLLASTSGRGAPFVYTSGCWVLGDTAGHLLGEDAPTDRPAEIVAWRVERERQVLDANGKGGPAAVVRPGVVFGRGGGMTARMFATARDRGAAELVGDGSNHWSLIHVDDLAGLYRAIVESGAGGVFHGVDDAPLHVEQVAKAASRAAGSGGAIHSLPLEAAREKLGPVADALCLDQTLCAPASRALGWRPALGSFTEAAPTSWEEWSAANP